MSTQDVEEQGWEAHLGLRFKKKNGITILAENQHTGPLTVQRPLYPENEVCHTYILHPPGGVVGGDTLNIKVSVEKDAKTLITTPGATKFYRSVGRRSAQHQKLHVSNGCLEWFPQDTIIFPGAESIITTDIHLQQSAQFFGWEVISLGLPTQKNFFSSGSLFSSLRLSRDEKPVFQDTLRVDGTDDLKSSAGLRGFPVSATFMTTGVEKELLPELRKLLPEPGSRSIAGMTLVSELLVCRYLGCSTFEARYIFEELWNWLRPVLAHRTPCPPRIWAT